MKAIKIISLVVLLLVFFGPARGRSVSTAPNSFIYKPELMTDENAFYWCGNRVNNNRNKEIWVGDPDYGSTIQDAVKTIGAVVATLRIPVGVHNIGGDLVIPDSLALKLEHGAVLTRTGGAHLTINGHFRCGPWQCFNDNSINHDWVVFGSGAVKGADPRWWGAKADGATDDGIAIIAAGKSLSNTGAKTLLFTNGNFRIYSVGTYYKNLGTFTGINGLRIISRGATLSIDPARTFPSQYGTMFQLTACLNVLIDGFQVTGPTFNIYNKESVEFVRASKGCTNINMPYNKLQGVIAGFITYRNVPGGDDLSYRCHNINIGLMEVDHCTYGVCFGWSGDDVKVDLLKTDSVGRSYCCYGVKNHQVTVCSKDPKLSDVGIWSWRGLGCEDIDVTYINTETTASVSDCHRIEIAWNDTQPAAFRNITIKMNSVFGASGTTGASAFRIVKYEDDLATKDTTDRGHELTSLTVSGYVGGVPSTPGSVLGTDAGCQWGGSGTPDVWRNIKFENLVVDGANTVNFATGAIIDFLMLDNVISTSTPWAVRKNFRTVNPAGKIIAHDSGIKNLYKKTDVWYDAILKISLYDYAVANEYTLSPKESGKLVDSEGITCTTTVNLPSAAPGLEYSINRAFTGTIRIKPLANEYINGGGTGKYLSLDSQGASVRLICDFEGVWQVRSSLGNTSFEPEGKSN